MNHTREKKRDRTRGWTTTLHALFGWFAAILLTVASGCGGSGGKSNPPGSGSTLAYNTYAGTQSVTLTTNPQSGAIAAGGVWTLSLDDQSDFFQYVNTSDANAAVPPTLGQFAHSNGFLDLTKAGGNPGSSGYSIEIPGRAVVMRPGDNSNFPVGMVVTDACPDFTAGATFQFITFVPPLYGSMDTSVYGAYGSVNIKTQGTVWNFSNLNMFMVDGTALSPTAFAAGTCAYTQEGFVANVPPSASSGGVGGNITTTVAIGPSGFFMADEGQFAQKSLSNNCSSNPQGCVPPVTSTWPFGLVGVVQPGSQLDTSAIVAGKYAGFEFQPLENTITANGGTSAIVVTQPVYFGQTAGAGTTITGGEFPNDDITQSPASDITIALGSQDSQNNGLYKLATITIPDVTNSCIGTSFGGTDASGNPTCIFPAVAVVGSPEKKFAIFVVAEDKRPAQYFNKNTVPPTVVEFLLYQQ